MDNATDPPDAYCELKHLNCELGDEFLIDLLDSSVDPSLEGWFSELTERGVMNIHSGSVLGISPRSRDSEYEIRAENSDPKHRSLSYYSNKPMMRKKWSFAFYADLSAAVTIFYFLIREGRVTFYQAMDSVAECLIAVTEGFELAESLGDVPHDLD